ncbi:MAG TPA: hypothetical protein VHN19_05755 [Burkholderiales bacterium]|jgi:hypothetical protein|nr:hypothetical protein [Burkholderiales bacterium]HEX2649428.1 hypothetical protein [Burkholderiales bacterium]
MGNRLDPQEDLVGYFERSTGQRIRTRADLERYLDCAEEVRPQWLEVDRIPRGSALFKQIVLALLFLIALAQYVTMDTLLEIARLPSNIYFVSSGRTS